MPAADAVGLEQLPEQLPVLHEGTVAAQPPVVVVHTEGQLPAVV